MPIKVLHTFWLVRSRLTVLFGMHTYCMENYIELRSVSWTQCLPHEEEGKPDSIITLPLLCKISGDFYSKILPFRILQLSAKEKPLSNAAIIAKYLKYRH